MKIAELHPEEAARLEELYRYEILDSEDEAAFDELTELASAICGTKISLISLIDDKRQWFKSRVGLDVPETDRDIAFCTHAIQGVDVMEVEDALADERFHDNPLVAGDPAIRFYAGAPLITPEGLPIGTLCVIDNHSMKLSEDQHRALEILARQVISQLELRLMNRRMKRIAGDRDRLFAVIAHDLKSNFSGILGVANMLSGKYFEVDEQERKLLADELMNVSVNTYELLDQLLQWAAEQMGGMKSRPVNCHIKQDLIDDNIDFFSRAGALQGVNLNISIDESLTVYCDTTMTKTIIRNLVSNALKYCSEDGLISIDAKEQHDGVTICISNTGDPISSEIRDNLFKQQVLSTEGRGGKPGHGLGLNLVAQFVAKQNGKIWVDEEFSGGTRICFRLGKSD
ncbi:GAF domain-containing sensor histidine kinase [Salinispira pacifica]|uniref:Histidine kinase domain-containing protein n=1 Tax=Salinispira pacifica TaxID=1307761 RepID=V5WER7_9SPIO|nr:GAF domain-containing sensor histidine kinase [Salinispira pacifica]AHC14120.1 hypothetical protein L21SP2_0693 [Salinispira pacifica]